MPSKIPACGGTLAGPVGTALAMVVVCEAMLSYNIEGSHVVVTPTSSTKSVRFKKENKDTKTTMSSSSLDIFNSRELSLPRPRPVKNSEEKAGVSPESGLGRHPSLRCSSNVGLRPIPRRAKRRKLISPKPPAEREPRCDWGGG